MQIDDASPKWPYEQLADQLRAAIQAGKLGPRLPAIQQLAQDADVSPATVQRALKILKDEDLVYGQDGRGVFVR